MAETKLESRLGTVLYHNEDTVLSSNITLSESAANFSLLKIFYKTNDSDYASIEVYNPDGKMINLLAARSASTYNPWLKTTTMQISGANINIVIAAQVNIVSTPQYMQGYCVNITTVLGFR